MQNPEKNDATVSAARPQSLQLQDGADERKHYTKYKRHLSMSREKIIQANKMKRPSSTPLISSNPVDHPEGERQFVNVLQEIHSNKPERVVSSEGVATPSHSLGRPSNRMPGLKLNIPASLNPTPASGHSHYSIPGHNACLSRGFMGSLTPNPTSLNPGFTSDLGQSKGRSCSLTDLLHLEGKRPRFQKIFFNVELIKKPGGKKLGFTVVGGQDTPGRPMGIHIKTIQPDGLAAEEGFLRQGDEVLEVNGISLAAATHQQAVAAFKQQKKGPVKLAICRIVQSSQRRKESLDEGVSMTSVPVSPFLKNPSWHICSGPEPHPTDEVSLTQKAETETNAESRASGTKATTLRRNLIRPTASNEGRRSIAATIHENDKTAAVSVGEKRPTSMISPEDFDFPSAFINISRSVLSANQMPRGASGRNPSPFVLPSPELFAQKKLPAELVSHEASRVSGEKDTEPDLLSEEILTLTEESTNPELMHAERSRRRSLPHSHRPRRPSTPRFIESTETEDEKNADDVHENVHSLPGSRKGSLSLVLPSQTPVPEDEASQNPGLDEEKQYQTPVAFEEVPNISTQISEKTSTLSEDTNAIDLALAISKQAFTASELFEETSNLTTELYDNPAEAEESLSRISCLPDEMPSISEEVEETFVTHGDKYVVELEQSNGNQSSGVAAAVSEQMQPTGLPRKLPDASAQVSAKSKNVEGLPVTDDHLSITSSRLSLSTTENAQYLMTTEPIGGGLEDHSNLSGSSRAEVEPEDMTTMKSDATANSFFDERTTADETRREIASHEFENVSEVRKKQMEIEITEEIIEDVNTTRTNDKELQTADVQRIASELLSKDDKVSNDEVVEREWQMASGREELSEYGEAMTSSGPETEKLIEIRQNVDMEDDAILHAGELESRKEGSHKAEEMVAKEEDNETENKDRYRRVGIEDDLFARGREERIASDDFCDLMLEPLSADNQTTEECPGSSSSNFQPPSDDSIDIHFGSSMTNPLLNRSKITSSDPKEEIGLIHGNRTKFSFDFRDNSKIQTSSASKENITPRKDYHPATSRADSITVKSSESDNTQIPSPFDPGSPNSDFFLTSDMVLTTPPQYKTRSPKQEKASPELPKTNINETISADDSKKQATEDLDTVPTSTSSANRKGLQPETTELCLLNEVQRPFEKETSDRARDNEAAGEMLIENKGSSTLDSVEGPLPQTAVNLAMNGQQQSVDHLKLLNSEASSCGKFFLTSDEIDPEIENRKNTNTETQIKPVFCAEKNTDRQTIPADERTENPLLSNWTQPHRDPENLLVPETRDSAGDLERTCFAMNGLSFTSDYVPMPATESSKAVSLNFQENIPEDLKDVESCTTDPRSASFASKPNIQMPVISDSKLAQRPALEDYFSNNQTSDPINEIESKAALVVAVENKPSRRDIKICEGNENYETAGASDNCNMMSVGKTKLANVEQYSGDSLTKQDLVLKASDPFHRKSNEFGKQSDITVGLHISDITSENTDRSPNPDNISDQPSISPEYLHHSLAHISFGEHPETGDDESDSPQDGLEVNSKGTECRDVAKPASSLKQRTQPAFLTLNTADIDIRVDQEEVDFDSDEVPPLPESAPPTAEAMPRSPFWLQLSDEFQFSPPEGGDHERFIATDINGNELLNQTLLSVQKEPDANEGGRETERIEPTGEASPRETHNGEATFSSCVRIQCDSRGITKTSFEGLDNTVEERTDSQKKLSIRFLQGIGSNIHWNLDEEDTLEHRSKNKISASMMKTLGTNMSALEDDDDKYAIGGAGKRAPSLTLNQDDSDRKTESGSIPIAILSYIPTASVTVAETTASVVSISSEEISMTSSEHSKNPE